MIFIKNCHSYQFQPCSFIHCKRQISINHNAFPGASHAQKLTKIDKKGRAAFRLFDSGGGPEILGIGPLEILFILGLGLILYGPDRLSNAISKKQFPSESMSNAERERSEEIEDMKKYAKARRVKRAWKRINEAVDNGDQDVINRLAEVDDPSS